METLMNQRIRELIEEADRRCSETRGVYDEILAEMIIAECISICNRRGEVLQKHLDERGKDMAEEPRLFTEGATSASFRNAQSIRQHFGVE
jgi:hypothetical protein